jgi:hypothetical protein
VVTVSEDVTVITIQGSADSDTTLATDDGTDVRVTNAIVGAGCTQSGTTSHALAARVRSARR